jgi:hypothetical protein
LIVACPAHHSGNLYGWDRHSVDGRHGPFQYLKRRGWPPRMRQSPWPKPSQAQILRERNNCKSWIQLPWKSSRRVLFRL